MDDELDEARDDLAPADPSSSQADETNPTLQLPQRGPPLGPEDSDLEDGEYTYWLRDGYTPYRGNENYAIDVFSQRDNAWKLSTVPLDDLTPSSAEEIAGMIGGRHRLEEPTQGVAPVLSPKEDDYFPDDSPDLVEAEASGDLDGGAGAPPRSQGMVGELPEGGMSEQQIRDAGLLIDLPYEIPTPKRLTYKDTGQRAWTPPPGFGQGLPTTESESGDGEGSGS